MNAIDRRGFLQYSSAGIGGAIGASTLGNASVTQGGVDRSRRLPREVWIASVEQVETGNTPDETADIFIARMKEIAPMQPADEKFRAGLQYRITVADWHIPSAPAGHAL
jgi:hypothetical protein